jgi:hypothetical protein
VIAPTHTLPFPAGMPTRIARTSVRNESDRRDADERCPDLARKV